MFAEQAGGRLVQRGERRRQRVQNLADLGENLTFIVHFQTLQSLRVSGLHSHIVTEKKTETPIKDLCSQVLFQKRSSALNRDPQGPQTIAKRDALSPELWCAHAAG